MNTRTLAAVAATALLALTACSSDKGDTPGGDNPDTPDFGGGFCEASAALENFDTASSAAQEDVDAAIANATDPNAPEVLAAIQAYGAAAKSDAEKAIAVLEGAKADVDDPEVDAALDTMIGLMEQFMLPMADAALGATDTLSWSTDTLELFGSEEISALLEDVDAATIAIEDYEIANCS